MLTVLRANQTANQTAADMEEESCLCIIVKLDTCEFPEVLDTGLPIFSNCREMQVPLGNRNSGIDPQYTIENSYP